MNIRFLFVTLGLIGLGYAVAPVNAAADNTQDFITKATIANEFEIESSKLALEKSQNKDIKHFAQQMVDDHTKTGDELKSVLQSSNIASPKEELDSSHQKIMDNLQNATTDDFNHQYIAVQTDAHKEAVKLFTDYSQHGDNMTIKTFAAQTLPTLQEHLTHVQQLKDKE